MYYNLRNSSFLNKIKYKLSTTYFRVNSNGKQEYIEKFDKINEKRLRFFSRLNGDKTQKLRGNRRYIIEFKPKGK